MLKKKTNLRVRVDAKNEDGTYIGTRLSPAGLTESGLIGLSAPGLDLEVGKQYRMRIDARHKDGNVRYYEPVETIHGTAYIDIYRGYDPEHVGSLHRIQTSKTVVNGRDLNDLKAWATRVTARHGETPTKKWKQVREADNWCATHHRHYTNGMLISLSYWIR